MNRIKCMFYEKQYKDKPSGDETGKIQNRFKQTEIEIEDLAIALSKGATFKPALLKGKKSADFISQQLFALDFDEGTTIQKEFDRCVNLNISPCFAYTSFSHTVEHHKFRLVFCSNKLITDINERNRIQETLMKMFPTVDIRCKDATRLFFGGKELINPNYEQRIDVDYIIKEFYVKDEINVKTETKNNKKTLKNKSNKQYININAYDKQRMNLKINAIIDMKPYILRDLLMEDRITTNTKILKSFSISGECIPQLTNVDTPTIISGEKHFFEYIYHLNLNEYLGIPEGAMVNCILPEHDDGTPSAHIYITDNGTPIYKCFGCGAAKAIIKITEELSGCSKSEAIEFIKKVYNIQLAQSEWEERKRQSMIDSANYLDTDEFKIRFHILATLIRTRKKHIQKMLRYFEKYVSDDLNVNGEPIFFASYEKLMKVCGIRLDDRRKMSQTLVLFALLNMLDKVGIEQIPVKELNKAKSIAAKYGHQKLTGFYQFKEYGLNNLLESESQAKILKENHITIAGISREYVLRTFGIDIANKIFPQYEYDNVTGTTEKSDAETLEIVNKIAKSIKKKGYVLEKDVRKSNDTQWKKSIQEILESYEWKKVKLNNELKEKYRITTKGYPFLIVNKFS